MSRILGGDGLRVVNVTCTAVARFAIDERLALVKIDATTVSDPEVGDWERVVVYLHFRALPDEIEGLLDGVYSQLDKFEQALNENERAIFRRFVFVDAVSAS